MNKKTKSDEIPEEGYCYCGAKLPMFAFKQMEEQCDSRYTHICTCGRVYRYHAPERKVMHVSNDYAKPGESLYLVH